MVLSSQGRGVQCWAGLAAPSKEAFEAEQEAAQCHNKGSWAQHSAPSVEAHRIGKAWWSQAKMVVVTTVKK